MLYRRTDAGRIDYFASGRVAGIRAPESGGRECEFDKIVWFDEPVLDDSESDNVAARRMMALSVERFTQIIDHGGISTGSMAEAGGLALDRELPKGYSEIVWNEVIARWGHRCAVTGYQFDPDAGDHPELRVVPIRSLSHGGSIEPGNFLPMIDSAERAWRRGVFAVASDGALMGNFDQLDDQLVNALQRQRKLLVPKRRDHQPDSAALIWHFNNVFGRY